MCHSIKVRVMKHKKFARAVLLIITCVVMQLEAIPSSSASPPEENGKVVGVVFDVNDARVVGAVITIKNKDFERKVVSGQAGEFEVELPVAKHPYWFTVQAHGFCTFEGELLRVRPKATEMINIHLEVQVTHTECKCSSRRK